MGFKLRGKFLVGILAFLMAFGMCTPCADSLWLYDEEVPLYRAIETRDLKGIDRWIARYGINYGRFPQRSWVRGRDCDDEDETHNVYRRTPLCFAAICGELDIVQLLIKRGACVNVCYEWRTPLHFAAERGYLDVVQYLVEHGAIVNYEGWFGTPLHHAAMGGYLDVVQYLVEHGADVSRVCGSWFARAPLHCAVSNNHLEVVKYLVEACHVDVNCRDERGEISLLTAICKEQLDVVQYLVEHGADVNCLDEIKEYMWFDAKSVTPLHEAVGKGNVEIIKILIKYGADPNVVCKNGETPLHIAAREGNIEIGEALINAKIPAYVNARDKKGKTPIVVAKENNHLGFAQMLINHGAKDEDPSSCLVM